MLGVLKLNVRVGVSYRSRVFVGMVRVECRGIVRFPC